MVAKIIEAFKNRSTSALAVAVGSSAISMAVVMIANTPYGTSLGAIPYTLFLLQLFAYEFLMIGLGIFLLLLIHRFIRSEMWAEFNTQSQHQSRSDIAFRATFRDRLVGKLIIYAITILAIASITWLSIPWIQHTGVFFRDSKLEPLYRKHLVLGAYDAEARGEYDLAIERLLHFKSQFPERAQLNDIDAKIKELKGLSQLSDTLSARADTLQTSRGFAADILDLRVSAVSAMPSPKRIAQLHSSIATTEEFIQTSATSVRRCNNSENISETEAGKTLVALGIVDNPERLFPTSNSSTLALCEIIRSYSVDDLPELLREQWNLNAIKDYLDNLRQFTSLERGMWRFTDSERNETSPDETTTSDFSDFTVGTDVENTDLSDKPSFSTVIGPISFPVPVNQVPAADSDTALISEPDVYIIKNIGIMLCWKHTGIADVLLTGVSSQVAMTRANGCELTATQGRWPRLNLEKPELLKILTEGMAAILDRLENGENVSTISRERSRRTLCFALITINTTTEDNTPWVRHCQIESLIHGTSKY